VTTLLTTVIAGKSSQTSREYRMH